MSRFFIHLHLYYLEQTNMLIKKLKVVKNAGSSDLICTMHDKNPEIEEKVKSVFPNARIIIVKNIGADIWPFICALNSVHLSDYDYIVKVHTKRFVQSKKWRMPDTNYLMRGNRWRNYLLEFLQPKKFAKCLKAFRKDEKLGMVSSYPVIIRDAEKHGKDNSTSEKTRALLGRLGYKARISYPAGTMFMARAELFYVIKMLDLKESDFGEFQSAKSDQLPHVLEQSLGSCVLGQGYELRDVFTGKSKIAMVKTLFFLNKLQKKIIKEMLRFFVKTKRDKDTRRISGVRILKLWVWGIK